MSQSDQFDIVQSGAAPADGRFDGLRISLENYAAGFILLDVLTLLGTAAFFSGLLEISRSPRNIFGDWQISAIGFALAFHFVLARLFNAYDVRNILELRYILPRLMLSLVSSFAVLLVIAVATKTAESYSRLWFFSWLASSGAIILLTRLLALGHAQSVLQRGACVYTALSVGMFCDPLRTEEIVRQSGNKVRAIGSMRLETVDELAMLSDRIAQEEIDQIYIVTWWEDTPSILGNLHLLRHLSARVFVLPRDQQVSSNIMDVGFFGERLSFRAMEEPIRGWDLWLKRWEDMIVAGIALLALSPVMALIALAIVWDSEGPVFFRQQRTGFNGKVFELWKFRSMYVDQTDVHASVQTCRGDRRVTRVGRFIRRTSLDELPQLFNVLMGTMSIVGPRPHALQTRAEGQNLEEIVDQYAVRHRVKPGLTGWAQVHGFRGELDSVEKLQKRVDYDLNYIDHWSIWRDLEIIFKTIWLIFHDRRAY